MSPAPAARGSQAASQGAASAWAAGEAAAGALNAGLATGRVGTRQAAAAVGQGIEVFVTSWRNPAAGQARWDLDTYAAAPAGAGGRAVPRPRRRARRHTRCQAGP